MPGGEAGSQPASPSSWLLVAVELRLPPPCRPSSWGYLPPAFRPLLVHQLSLSSDPCSPLHFYRLLWLGQAHLDNLPLDETSELISEIN